MSERTGELNKRIDQLNMMAGKVSDYELALERSEGDVKTLERRQRQLANEKAAIDDERARLEVEQAALLDQQEALFDLATASVA